MPQNVTYHQQIGLIDLTTGGNAPATTQATSTRPVFLAGSGAPTCAAPKGSLYLNIAGTGVADRAYINTNGSTGWTNLTTAA